MGDENKLSQVEEKPKKQRLLEVVGDAVTLIQECGGGVGGV